MSANTFSRAAVASLCACGAVALALAATSPGSAVMAAPPEQKATATPKPQAAAPANRVLRFFGTGANGIDRVKIPLGNPSKPVNVGNGDFTIEFWMKANAADNRKGYQCSAANDDWINGHILIDRDVYFAGAFGDYGLSLGNGRLAFGVNNGSDGVTLCGKINVADGKWHHIAVQRRAADGQLWLFVDGKLDAQTQGPSGDISYDVNRSTDYPNDPFLVLGAEKHDAGSEYPSYRGLLDELRISNVLRYTADFKRPTARFAPDDKTVALYHFDESSGDVVSDSSGAAGGPSDGKLVIGGAAKGPARVADALFATR